HPASLSPHALRSMHSGPARRPHRGGWLLRPHPDRPTRRVPATPVLLRRAPPPLVGTPPRRRGRRRGCRGLGRIEPSKGLHQPPRGGGTGSAFTAALVAVDPASRRDR